MGTRLTKSLFALLSISSVAAVLEFQGCNPRICSLRSPFLRDHNICAASRPVQQAPSVRGIEPEPLDNKYTPPAEYRLPPPWDGPEQCVAEFCVYSNRHVADGMALITTARNAHLAAHYPIAAATGGVEPTAFYEAEVPGKGIGLIANRTIRKGETIMQRVPVLLVQWTPHFDLDPALRDHMYQAAVARLPEASRRRFLRQTGDTLYDKTERNSFRMFVDGGHEQSAHLGVFPDASRFNHDCRPNVHYRIANLTHTTIAVRDIPPGEELTISYIYGLDARSERQAKLRDWGFACACSQCTRPDWQASDARLQQITRLEEAIEAGMTTRTVSDDASTGIRPEMGGRLAELYRAERLDAYLGPTYTRAALIYSMFGDEERAREYAGEAALALERENGPPRAGTGDVESIRRLAKDPTAHWSWGIKLKGLGRGPGAKQG